MTELSVQKVYKILKDEKLPIGSKGRSGQISGVGHWTEGFVGEYGGTLVRRCKRCHQTSAQGHKPGCIATGAQKWWKQDLDKDGTVRLTYVSTTTSKESHETFVQRREATITKAIAALTAAGLTIVPEAHEAHAVDHITVKARG